MTITGFDEEEEKLIWSNWGECEESDWNMLFDTDKKYYVSVKVEGNSTIIGNIRSADIMVYPSYAGVSGAGKVTLRLQARVTNTTDFPGDIECTVESPSTIDVVFDEVSEKTVPVTVDASAVTISCGL